VDGNPPFALIIGNAHYVKLSYDDRPVDLAPHVKVEVARFTLD
jgi:cytoskeleton protein RodZ